MASVPTATLAEDYAILTKACGLVDRSERGKLALSGSGAIEFLNGQVTNELVGLKPGEGRYAAFLTHKGKMMGDLRILAAGDDPEGEPGELLLDTERVALQSLFDMIRRFKVGYDVDLHKRTMECSLLSLIGPGVDRVAARAVAGEPSGEGCVSSGGMHRARVHARAQGTPKREHDHPLSAANDPNHALVPASEHDHLLFCLGDTPVRLIRTDLGLDVVFAVEALHAVRTVLVDAGAVETSESAAEIVRVEQGRPRYGIDLDHTTIPQEADLNERAVSFTKGCYVGQETVARLYYKGKPNRHLRGLRLSEPAPAGAELRLGERAVGTLTSSVLSPTFGPIGLALLRREAEPGATLAVGDSGASATVCELPFA